MLVIVAKGFLKLLNLHMVIKQKNYEDLLIVLIPSSLPWFSAASALSIVYRNHFVCISRINLLNLKESSDMLGIAAKGFLKQLNLHMLIKQKNYGELLIVFSTNVNLLYLLYSLHRGVAFCA